MSDPKDDKLAILGEMLDELSNAAATDTKLDHEYVKGYNHVAQMVIDYCARSRGEKVVKTTAFSNNKPKRQRSDN